MTEHTDHHPPRDLIGHAGNPRWPGRARLTLNFVMNCEQGSEPPVQDEGHSERGITGYSNPGPDTRGHDLRHRAATHPAA